VLIAASFYLSDWQQSDVLSCYSPSDQLMPQAFDASVTVERRFIKLCERASSVMTLVDICPVDWRSHLDDVLTSVTALGIENQLAQELANGYVYYPQFDRLFAALEGLRPSEVRVVILGQDPYHGEHQATGRAFEVWESTPAPPSLINIGKMLERDLGVAVGSRFQIGRWSEQGVLLLNTTLSVRAGEPESHKGLGWQTITDRIISVIAASDKPTVFLLWGAHAQKKSVLVNGPRNLVLMAPHPSPLSAYRGFFDCAHFSATNQWLTMQGERAIRWETAC